MVAGAKRAFLRTSGLIQRVPPFRVRSLSAASSAGAIASAVLGVLCSWSAASAGPGEAVAMIATFGLAGFLSVTAMVQARASGMLGRGLDMLVRCIDALPDAHLIVAPEGQIGYANAAFDRLFPDRVGFSVHGLERDLCHDPEAHAKFRDLSDRA